MRHSVLLRLDRVMKRFPLDEPAPARLRPRGAPWGDNRKKVRQRWSAASDIDIASLRGRQRSPIASRAPGENALHCQRDRLARRTCLSKADESSVRQASKLRAIGELLPLRANPLGMQRRVHLGGAGRCGPAASRPTGPQIARHRGGGTRSRGDARPPRRWPRRGRTARCSGWAASSPGGAGP